MDEVADNPRLRADRRRPGAVPARPRDGGRGAPGSTWSARPSRARRRSTRSTRSSPGLVLMDINLPGINGIEATRRITAAHPEAVVMLLSTYRAADLPTDAGTCGAAAYVHKEEFGPAASASWPRRAAWRTDQTASERSPDVGDTASSGIAPEIWVPLPGAESTVTLRRWRRGGRSCSRSRGRPRRVAGRSRRRRRPPRTPAPSSSRTWT